MAKRRKFTDQFKATVALETLRGDKTIQEIAARHQVLQSCMLARKPSMLVAIALANKMARQMLAMLTKNEDYRGPPLAGAA